MKTFNRIAAQGDCMLIRINTLPADKQLQEVKPVAGQFVIAHSETGHNHVMSEGNVMVYQPAEVKEVDLYELFMVVKEPTELRHLREFDTHEALMVPEGTYMIRRQREYTPEGFRRAAD